MEVGGTSAGGHRQIGRPNLSGEMLYTRVAVHRPCGEKDRGCSNENIEVLWMLKDMKKKLKWRDVMQKKDKGDRRKEKKNNLENENMIHRHQIGKMAEYY